MEEGTLPMGFALLMMQNESAMRSYEKMTEAEKEKLMYRIRGVQSKSEMRRLVSELTDRPDANEAVGMASREDLS